MSSAQLTLGFVACEGCGASDRWIRVAEACACGWSSKAYRRKLHIAASYAAKKGK